MKSIRATREHARPLFDFLEESGYAQSPPAPDEADLVFGNPHEMPLPGVVDALRAHALPQDTRWFAYKMNEREGTEPVAESLRALTGLPFRPEDVVMTTGAFGALSVVLRALCEPGDDVIYFDPPWFFYAAMIAATYATPRALPLSAPRFEPDLDQLRDAIGPRTRAVIFNHPHNPSGRVYGSETLAGIAEVLRDASEAHGHPVRAIADEAYRRVLFDGRSFESLATHYPETLAVYTYGKTLLAPGQRLGYIALPPTMQGREELLEDLETAQLSLGFLFPNAIMQRATADLEKLTIDIGALQRRRDLAAEALPRLGCEVIVPEGTFYMLVRPPGDGGDGDDRAFTARLRARGTHVLPGSVCELPGWLRLSLTANDAMLERALEDFAAVTG